MTSEEKLLRAFVKRLHTTGCLSVADDALEEAIEAILRRKFA